MSKKGGRRGIKEGRGREMSRKEQRKEDYLSSITLTNVTLVYSSLIGPTRGGTNGEE